MRILLLSAYHAQSHQYWCDGLVSQFPECEWGVLTLPPRHFSWRIRGNGLTWSLNEARLLNQTWDKIVATSMVDLATLRGLVPALGRVPCLLYFHENQFDYPKTHQQHKSVEPQMVTLYSALAADKLLFNSEYNRSTFLSGVDNLLRRLPDGVPTGVTALLAEKSRVLSVPLFPIVAGASANNRSGRVLNVVWNHRWEYDKGGELLYQAIMKLPANTAIRFYILGQSFRRSPDVFAQIKAMLLSRGWLGHWGYVQELDEYHQILRKAHVVVSTALHDFQGLSVLEAVSAGCMPLVPDRLAYKELFPSAYRYQSSDGNTPAVELLKSKVVRLEEESCNKSGGEAWVLASRLMWCVGQVEAGAALPLPSVSHLYWTALKPSYQKVLLDTA